MTPKKLEKLIFLLKKCTKQPILFQKLYSHTSWILTNELKKIDTSKYDQISQIIIHGATKTKSPFEKQMLEFIRSIKKTKNKDDIFKLIIIMCYFLNQESSFNFIVLNEMLNNFVFKNDVLDYLICKYLVNTKIGIYYENRTKHRIQNDIISSFLIQCRSKKMNFASKCILLPVYMTERVEPFKIEKEMVMNDFGIRMLEAFHFFATYTKQSNLIKNIIPQNVGFTELFEAYGNKMLKDKEENVQLNINKLWIEENEILFEIKKAYEKSKNKQTLKEKLDNLIKSLQ